MIHYQKILELYDEGISLRVIAASTGNSRQKVTEVISLAEKEGISLSNRGRNDGSMD
ncbi:helix-turn-helix domain containing protein [Halobacillus amylolyticus]|uniref:Helix-turn-helix domain containing protein n=1 Tax=Halobacillus amylolyticus TaxID=2932259 RepID=A0ABY4HBB5_9BACI|nr:helix-turn-helix domain containing protein [Halobacillus amylolyticus]UOR11999.1 helix-turn-helix domain containing protein [Halobacillus amylolyticus]